MSATVCREPRCRRALTPDVAVVRIPHDAAHADRDFCSHACLSRHLVAEYGAELTEWTT